MISISKKKFSFILKTGFSFLALYSATFAANKTFDYYKTSQEKLILEKELQLKKDERNKINIQVAEVERNIKEIKNRYISKEDLDLKIKKIFKRMSVLDYNLSYVDSKQICVDRYILVTRITANSQKGLNAAEGILSYLGKYKQSNNDSSFYYVDYLAQKKRGE